MVALALLPALLLVCCTISVATFTFHSPDGFALVRQILLDALPTFEPHTYQMDGVCKVLDRIDLVAVTPTGSGKTGFFFLTILVMIAITANPLLCPSASFPKDPAIVVVCPANSIEQQMEENMAKMGIRALMINADTVAAARIRGEELWIKACEGISMLILGPEQLISKGFQDLLKFERFYERIGFMRARFRPGIPIIGLTATLLADPKVSDSIFDYLGVNRGEFYLLRRSNSRHDIQILFRTLHSGIDGVYFPELAWVVCNNDKTIIFATTISLVFRIKIYLDSHLPRDVDPNLRIRTYHSINWPDENLETIELFKSNPLCQIIIATNGLAQGNDINVVQTVIQVGEPESAEMFVQKPRRARPNVTNPRAIFYISALHAKKDGAVAMDRTVAEIITAHCKPLVQDKLFANPVADTAGCLPEQSPEVYVPKPREQRPRSDIPQAQRLTKVMKEVGMARLEEFRLAVWFEASDLTAGLTPLAEFLPDIVIQLILDRFARLQTVEDVADVVKNIVGMQGQHLALFIVVVELRGTFLQMKRDKAAAAKTAKALQASSSSLSTSGTISSIGPSIMSLSSITNSPSMTAIEPRVA
ncbi:P-loop containing nucleoside triphosphate hydrolase protein [Mycena olivaceomarginata]|nr:P-loop containing nucleoside triphosphate hydrolase protein [Mycena olivaceomarginata]